MLYGILWFMPYSLYLKSGIILSTISPSTRSGESKNNQSPQQSRLNIFRIDLSTFLTASSQFSLQSDIVFSIVLTEV